MMTVCDFKEISKKARIESLKLVHQVDASHIGGSFSVCDILTVLYNGILNVDPQNPKWDGRDRLLFSKGHSCTALYSILAQRKFISSEELNTFGKNGSFLTTHINHYVPGIELSTGSLGHALSVGCGMALSAKRKREAHRIFVLLSDGELDEGSNWEAFLFAPQHKLDNLIVIIDNNKIQSFGNVIDVIDLNPLDDKLRAFNWEVKEINGHNHDEIFKTLCEVPFVSNKPSVIIAHTIKGKGVDFMENKLKWHYSSPSKEQLEVAIKQIEQS